jgi:hypothetical protein
VYRADKSQLLFLSTQVTGMTHLWTVSEHRARVSGFGYVAIEVKDAGGQCSILHTLISASGDKCVYCTLQYHTAAAQSVTGNIAIECRDAQCCAVA